MSTTFRRYVPEQSLLMPSDVRDWLPEGHLAHHISDLVDGLDLTAFYAPYEGDGRRNAPYDPRMMVKVLLYAYATGVFSSRGIARKLEEDVAFRVLGAGNFPQHRTVCEFRRRHLADFKRLFVEVVALARELGLVRFGKLSVDGTKVRANASKRKAMSYGRMRKEERRLTGEVDALLRSADATDVAEDVRLCPEVRGDELPAELRRREDRLAAIRAAKARLEAAARAADDARGREPGQTRNPKGGAAVQAGVWRRRRRTAGSSTCWASGAQPAWTGEGAGRVGPGVPGGEREAPALADGGVTGRGLGFSGRESGAPRGLWRGVRPVLRFAPPVRRASPARRPAAYAMTPCVTTRTSAIPRTSYGADS